MPDKPVLPGNSDPSSVTVAVTPAQHCPRCPSAQASEGENRGRVDPISRDVEYVPPAATPYDPRCLLQGMWSTSGTEGTCWHVSAGLGFGRVFSCHVLFHSMYSICVPPIPCGFSVFLSRDVQVQSGIFFLKRKKAGVAPRFLSGFFDYGSFVEVLPDWGRTVACGRARLGGIPVGVISVETRNVKRMVPADPANVESSSAQEPQAGQVFFFCVRVAGWPGI